MYKTLLAATTAISLIGANSLWAQSAPTMPVEIVSQDTATYGDPDERHLLVPLLFLVLLMGAAGGSSHSYGVSDERLKTDIVRIGASATGLPLYEFRYRGMDGRFQGVMAQDVLTHTPEAVVTHASGYMMVDYGLLGLEMTRVN